MDIHSHHQEPKSKRIPNPDLLFSTPNCQQEFLNRMVYNSNNQQENMSSDSALSSNNNSSSSSSIKRQTITNNPIKSTTKFRSHVRSRRQTINAKVIIFNH